MTELTPTISIIVPIYNVEKYLVRCLDSIFNQQVDRAYEVIAVNDGSTDNSLNILKTYQKKQPRLIIIDHGYNKKLSVARTTGMNIASGEYLMHVDSDDWLMPKALDTLNRQIDRTNADVIVFNYIREDAEGKKTVVRKIKKEFISTDKQKVQSHFYGAVWNKIVKRSITNNLLYGQKGINNGEDLLYANEILIRAENISLITDILYTYYVNSSSLTQTATTKIRILTLSNITHELNNLLIHYKQRIMSHKLYTLRLEYSIDFICKNMMDIRKRNIDITPLISELQSFQNIHRTNINLSKLSNNIPYFIMQFIFGRIKIQNVLHAIRSVSSIKNF